MQEQWKIKIMQFKIKRKGKQKRSLSRMYKENKISIHVIQELESSILCNFLKNKYVNNWIKMNKYKYKYQIMQINK